MANKVCESRYKYGLYGLRQMTRVLIKYFPDSTLIIVDVHMFMHYYCTLYQVYTTLDTLKPCTLFQP